MTATPLLLLVEDHDLVLEFLECIFQDEGYATLGVSDGKAALAALKVDPHRFCAIITDIQLGSHGPSGWDIGREARALAPQMPVVYMTANDTQDWLAKGVPKSALVSKPFMSDDFIEVVADLLNKARHSSGRSEQAIAIPYLAAQNASAARSSLPQVLAS